MKSNSTAKKERGSERLPPAVKKPSRYAVLFSSAAKAITRTTGRPATSIVALCVIVVWALSGPIFDYSDTWQLVINTGTSIITFLMVFVIQQSQNKDTIALQLKLNELIACQKNASNRLIDIEDLTEDELEVLKKYYIKLSDLAEKENDLYSTHSIDDAGEVHNQKKRKARQVGPV
jgi:low affinity Fe/Cu permease